MESIKTYQTVCAVEVMEFDAAVNRRIALGWQPYGPPYAIADTLCQAMVQFAEAEESHSGEYSSGAGRLISDSNRFPHLDATQLKIKRR